VSAATACVNHSSLHTYSPEQTISELGALTGQNMLKLILGQRGQETIRTLVNTAILQLGQEVLGFDIVMLVRVFFI